MAITRKDIEALTFTVKKGKYYLGQEVDEALERISAGIDELHRELADVRGALEAFRQRDAALETTSQAAIRYVETQLHSGLTDMEEQLKEKREQLEALNREQKAKLDALSREEAAFAERTRESVSEMRRELKRTASNVLDIIARWESQFPQDVLQDQEMNK